MIPLVSTMLLLTPIMLLSLLVELLLMSFITIPATLCEIARYAVVDFNLKLRQDLIGPLGNLELDELANDYRRITELLNYLNECVGVYLFLVHCALLPYITMLLYLMSSSSVKEEYQTIITIAIIEVSVVAAVNIWFPTVLNEEVGI